MQSQTTVCVHKVCDLCNGSGAIVNRDDYDDEVAIICGKCDGKGYIEDWWSLVDLKSVLAGIC